MSFPMSDVITGSHAIRTAGAVLAGVIAFSATAMSPPPEVRTSTVSYGDLNLATQRGEQTLLNRINHAAARDCGGYPDAIDLDAYARFETCHSDAMNAAVKSIGNPSVTALYDKEAHLHLS